MNNTPTPRTDAVVVSSEIHGYSEFDEGFFVAADFARRAHPHAKLHVFHLDLSALTAEALAKRQSDRETNGDE